MKVIVDTNVFVSGIFFTGPPYRILQAWKEGQIQLVTSPSILAEYREVALRLSERYSKIDILPIINLVMVNAAIVEAESFTTAVCDDPDDDMFLACSIASDVQIIVSGDKHLLKLNGYHDIAIIRPKTFVDYYLKD
jgi:putative PIN family toxin of toxin-antitoxin system